MKYLYILIICFTTNIGIAQTPIYPYESNGNPVIPANEGAYFKDTLNKFDQWTGTWQYSNGNTLFKIVITKAEAVYCPKTLSDLPYNCYRDLLIGGYYYKENGVIKTDHLIYSDIKSSPIMFVGDYDNLSTKIRLYYEEIEKQPNLRGGHLSLTLLPGSTNQAKWEFNPAYRRNYSVPDNIILTKLP